MSSIQPAQHKSPLVPSLFKPIRSGYSLGMLSKDVSADIKKRTIEMLEMVGIANSEGVYTMGSPLPGR